MVSRSAGSTEAQAPAAQRRTQSENATHADDASSFARSALTFAARCHAGQRRESDDAPFIEHPSEVARLLRDAGCSGVVIAAGLLHGVVDNTEVSLAELTERFGTDVADLVQVVTEDGVGSYSERKRVTRERVSSTGGDAALLFAADKIAEVHELADQVRRERARFGAMVRDSRARDHMERYQRMRVEHYKESLAMLQRVAPRHPLVKQLALELANCPAAPRRRGAAGD